MDRALIIASVALMVSCGSSPPAPSCDFAVTLDTVTCRFYDNPDQFASDSWFLDFSGTASGPVMEHAQTQLIVRDPQAINITLQCASWSQSGSAGCLSQATQPGNTAFTGSVEILVSGMASITATVTATVDQVGQAQCTSNKSVQKTISCP